MIEEEILIDLYLLSHKGVGNKKITYFHENGSDTPVFEYFKKFDAEISKSNYLKWLETFEKCMKIKDIKILSYKDSNYPDSLKAISSKPMYLFYMGNIDLISSRSFAVVGSRNPTHYGVTNTQKIVSDLSNSGFKIVSGLAVGIDSVAHNYSLKNGTIAVLGGGFNNIYPRSNISLFDSIVENNGLVLSEYSPDAFSLPAFFPQRSRIIAGLCSGLLVTEAAKKSGSLIAANLAFEYGKNVFALPADVTRENSQGCNELIMKNIAKLIYDSSGILEEYGNYSNKIVPNFSLESLNERQKEIIRVIRGGISDLNQLLLLLEWSSEDILMELTLMEMEGLIQRTGSEIYLNL